MKTNYLFLVILLLGWSTAYTQSGPAASKKGQATSNASKTYNQNVNAGLYLKDIKERYIMVASVYEKYQSKLVNTGKKDPAGNTIFNVEFYKNEELKYILIPDFEDYPLYYYLFGVSKDLMRGKERYLGRGHVLKNTNEPQRIANIFKVFQLTPTSGQSFYNTGPGGGSLEIISSIGQMDKDKSVAWNYFEFRGDYNEVNVNNKNRLRSDWEARWNAAYDWSERMIKKYEGKGYEELLQNININIGVVKSHSSFDSCKVTYKYDQNKKITEINFQFPFLDNKFYDKEQFFAKAVKNKDGYFQVQNKNKELNIGDGLIVIPFEGRLLLCNYDYGLGSYNLSQIISNNYADALETNILHRNKVYSVFGSVEADVLNKPTDFFGEWWKLKHFEQKYIHDKDLLEFSNFLAKYLSVIKK
jgi:hypothetical protein